MLGIQKMKKDKGIAEATTSLSAEDEEDKTPQYHFPSIQFTSRNASSKYDFVKVSYSLFFLCKKVACEFSDLLLFIWCFCRLRCGWATMPIITMFYPDFCSAEH